MPEPHRLTTITRPSGPSMFARTAGLFLFHTAKLGVGAASCRSRGIRLCLWCFLACWRIIE